jgi:hypothetical protein
MPGQRLVVLCAALLGVLLLLVVPYRLQQQGRRMRIVYTPVWDAPYSPKGQHDANTPVCPDGGPFIPLLLAEFAALTIGTLILRDRLGRGDETKLESYPGYQRGF